MPRSTRSIHRLLREQGRIAPRVPHAPDPIERPQPMEQWQLDFKDASTVPAEPEGKQHHVVETLNSIDTGTSVLIGSHVRSDFTAETALAALAQTFGSAWPAPCDYPGSRPALGGRSPRQRFPCRLDPLLSLPGGGRAPLCSASSAAQRFSCILHSFRIVSVFVGICEHTSQEHAHREAGRPPSHDHSSQRWGALQLVPRP